MFALWIQRKRGSVWGILGYPNGVMQYAASLQPRPGSGDCHRPAPAPAVHSLQTCYLVKIPRVTQKDFWTMEDYRGWREEGPATLSICLCQVYEHWANLIRVYNICNLGEVWAPALTGVSQVIWRPAQPQPVFMIHDDYRSSSLLRLKLPMWVRIQQDAGRLKKGETVRAI